MSVRIYRYILKCRDTVNAVKDADEKESDPRPVVTNPNRPVVVSLPVKIKVIFEPFYDDPLPDGLVSINGRSVEDYTVLPDGFRQYIKNLLSGKNRTYKATFRDIPGYVTPNTINVYAGNSYVVTYRRAVPPKPVLKITTQYQPRPQNTFEKGVIYVNGKEVGKGGVELTVDPGEYMITFGDIQVQGYYFKTPKAVRVVLNEGDSRRVIGVYQGEIIPPAYWLKPFEDIDKKYLAFEKIEGLFSNDIRNLTTYYTSSITASMENYVVDVYHEQITVPTSSIQFSLTYGHSLGYGSDNEDNNNPNNTPTKAIYGQYRNKILETSNSKFNLTGRETDHFYIINYQHDRLQNALDFGAFELNLATLSGSQYISGSGEKATHTGSNVVLSGDDEVIRLISTSDSDVGVHGYSYDIVSGTLEGGIYNADDPHVYGKMYVNHGVVLLDANVLDISASFGTVDLRETDGDNFLKLYTSISGAAQYSDASGDLLGMRARRKVIEYNDYYFLRVGNKEFNRTNNNTYYSGSEGTIVPKDLRDNATTYITTIGLYNENRELLAVGKLPRPVKKDFKTERLFKVRLKH